ncbi:MAG TPA: Fur family transcriptional regulator [Caulobacteraceae bacterium]
MSAPCAHDHDAPPSAEAVGAALVDAEALTVAAGQKWTPARARVLDLLLQAGGPVKAYDLIAAFKAGAATAPPTVYRALDSLAALGLVHRIASLNAYVACHQGGADHGAAFLICDCCEGVEEYAAQTGGLRGEIAAATGFEASGVTLEARGYCARCRG